MWNLPLSRKSDNPIYAASQQKLCWMTEANRKKTKAKPRNFVQASRSMRFRSGKDSRQWRIRPRTVSFKDGLFQKGQGLVSLWASATRYEKNIKPEQVQRSVEKGCGARERAGAIEMAKRREG
jgi:hypothetical protein